MITDKKILLVTNIPAPYRVPVFDIISEHAADFLVYYRRDTESNRKWKIPQIKHRHLFGNRGDKSLLQILRSFNPDVIITSGFTPLMLICWVYSVLKNRKHAVMTDSWLRTINRMSIFHKAIRRIVFLRTDVFICTGIKGRRYLMQYGVQPEKIFTSPLAVNNDLFERSAKSPREFDLMYSGQFTENKLPFFMCEVVRKVKECYPQVRLLLIGSGPLEKELLNKLDEMKVSYEYAGFIQQEELPRYYSRARVLLFPTNFDAWGIVANEAMASGTPVVTCNNAGCAGDLVLHGKNGFVLPLDARKWAEHTLKLLTDEELHSRMSRESLRKVKSYSFRRAADEIIKAVSK